MVVENPYFLVVIGSPAAQAFGYRFSVKEGVFAWVFPLLNENLLPDCRRLKTTKKAVWVSVPTGISLTHRRSFHQWRYGGNRLRYPE